MKKNLMKSCYLLLVYNDDICVLMILDFDSFIFLVSFLIDILRGFSRFLKLRIILAVRVFIGVIYII